MIVGQIVALIVLLQFQFGNSYLMVCYYENWAQYRTEGKRMVPEDIDPDLCTHIIFAFAQVNNETFLLEHYEYNDIEMYRRLVDLKYRKPSLKILLGVGGWTHGTEPFTRMSATRSSRLIFISHTIMYLRRYGMDGLDMDWEYPGGRGSPAEDKHRFTLLCEELKAAFIEESLTTGRDRLLLTAAVSAGLQSIMKGYEISALSGCLDFINLISYDFYGGWNNFTGHGAPLYGRSDDDFYNVKDAAIIWLDGGMPKEKIIIGLSAYGHLWRLTSGSNGLLAPAVGRGTLPYHDYCVGKFVTNEIFDEISMVFYSTYEDQWLSLENAESLKAKCEFITTEQYGGAMLWALGQDDHTGLNCGQGRYPLLNTVHTCLTDAQTTTTTATTTITSTTTETSLSPLITSDVMMTNETTSTALLPDNELATQHRATSKFFKTTRQKPEKITTTTEVTKQDPLGRKTIINKTTPKLNLGEIPGKKGSLKTANRAPKLQGLSKVGLGSLICVARWIHRH